MPDAYNSNTTMLDAIPVQLNPQMCRRWREEMYAWTMKRGGENIALTMVLIEDVLTLLLMVLICPPVNACL